MVRAVLDYRMAREAVHVMQEKDRAAAFTRFESNPALGAILVRMARAQSGRPVNVDVGADAEAQRVAAAIRTNRRVD